MAVTRRRGRREALARTPAYRTFEALGLAIGRLCMGVNAGGVAVSAGFTRALQERVAGRKYSPKDISDAIAEAEGAIAEMKTKTNATKKAARERNRR